MHSIQIRLHFSLCGFWQCLPRVALAFATSLRQGWWFFLLFGSPVQIREPRYSQQIWGEEGGSQETGKLLLAIYCWLPWWKAGGSNILPFHLHFQSRHSPQVLHWRVVRAPFPNSPASGCSDALHRWVEGRMSGERLPGFCSKLKPFCRLDAASPSLTLLILQHKKNVVYR